MEIRVTDKGMVELSSNITQQNMFTYVYVYKEEFTPFELEQLIKKLNEAAREARYKQKGIKITQV